eukprot:XP_001700752.1 predicted protein [Chlamydomonas reinhardtii]
MGDYAPVNKTLRFPVCNGFANQRLSILYGVVLAKRLGRAAVLPVLVDNGLQRGDAAIPFEEMYDLPHFIASMAGVGVRLLRPAEAPPANTVLRLAGLARGQQGGVSEALATTYASIRHIAIDCPLFKLGAEEMQPGFEPLVWAALNGLRPSKEAAALAASDWATAAYGPARPFNFIHLRIENDWIEHCRRWEGIRDGIVRDNCYRHTEEVHEQLALFGFSNSTPLYVAATGTTWSRRGGSSFIGNSVSTFAALAMLERRRAGSWSGQYDYLLKGAVRSALATRSFTPYCIFMGNESSAIHSWLVAHNVTVIAHEPAWREQLLALAGRKAQNAGVIVANLPVMRRHYAAFIAMMLDPRASEGLYYHGYGPADQGIINKFYESDLRGRMLNQLFNAKPYSTFDPSAYLLHFHGPKPHEYAAYLNTGQCEFKGLCEKAFAMSLCRYTREWARWVPEEPVALRLGDACGLLDNPAFQRLRGTTS